jgi:hypothetical protein
MIQRVQTLFLLAITGSSSLLLFKPFLVVKDGENTNLLSLMPGCLIDIVKPVIYAPMALNFIILALSLYVIFKFKNRRKQIKFCQIILALSALLIGSMFALDFLNNENANATVQYTKYAFIPAVNIVMAFMARWFIKKDDKLVRSADRIR